MRWLADENIPGRAIAFLRQRGEDVAAIAELALAGKFIVISANGMRQRALPATA